MNSDNIEIDMAMSISRSLFRLFINKIIIEDQYKSLSDSASEISIYDVLPSISHKNSGNMNQNLELTVIILILN